MKVKYDNRYIWCVECRNYMQCFNVFQAKGIGREKEEENKEF